MPSSLEHERSMRAIMRVNPQRAATERKNRKALSCDPCRRRKVKCDRSSPCNQCIRHKTVDSCQYITRASHRVASDVTAPTSRSDQSPPPQVNQAPSPQRTISGLEATCASDHSRRNEGSCSPHTPHSVPASTAGLDPAIQSLGQSSFPGYGGRTRFFGRSHWALTVDMVLAYPPPPSRLHDLNIR